MSRREFELVLQGKLLKQIQKYMDCRSEAKAIQWPRRKAMLIVLVVVLLLLSLGSFPAWPYSRSWGYYPSGGLGLVVLVLVILLLMGRI
jgi:preprotein translocase subunit SecE